MSLIEFQLSDNPFDQDGNKSIEFLDSSNNTIGHGQYQKYQKKGTWKEVIEVYGQHIITAQGNYNEGKKEGKWIYSINDEQLGEKTYIQDKEIGSSFCYFIYKQPNISKDIWYLVEDFLLYEGQRITQSFIYNFNKFIQCGNYFMGGIKKGKWIELEQDSIIFDQQKQIYSFICSEGMYVEGIKDEVWESTLYEQYEHQVHQHLVSKGKYQEGRKTGIWTEPIGYSSKANILTTIRGNYKNNQKHGDWKLVEGENTDEIYNYGGTYEQGRKINDWQEIRIFQDFHVNTIIHIQDEGQYNDDGKRDNEWTSESSGYNSKCFYENGVLNGKAELLDCIGNFKILLIRSKGEFKNGKKYGRWKTSIYVDEKWILFDVGEYVNDVKVGLWRESQYFDQYNLDENEKEQGQILLIKEGHYGDDGKKKDEWTWRFKYLTSYSDYNQIFKLIGKEVHNENRITGNLILFDKTFGKYDARFYFCDVFDGEILNGYRNGEWKFSAISNLVQNEINSKDTDSENEKQQNESENENENEEQNEEQNEIEQQNLQEEENEYQNENEEEYNQQDQENQVFQIYNNGIVIHS